MEKMKLNEQQILENFFLPAIKYVTKKEWKMYNLLIHVYSLIYYWNNDKVVWLIPQTLPDALWYTLKHKIDKTTKKFLPYQELK